MIAAELRGGGKPSLNEALGWIGSRVDDIYGAAVGRLEDVWIDPGTGAPRWLLVQKGGIGGRSTLIPFEDANAGAGHVWIPYERDVVADAPEVDPAAPLTQQAEAQLRRHYVMYAARGAATAQASVPAPATSETQQPRAQQGYERQEPAPSGRESFGPAPVPHRPASERVPTPPPTPSAYEDQPPPLTPPPAPPRPPAPEASSEHRYPSPSQPAARPSQPAAVPPHAPPPPIPGAGIGNGVQAPATEPAPPEQTPHAYGEHGQGHPAPPPRPEPIAIPRIDQLDRPYRVEIELRGEVRISGELTGLRLTPIDEDQGTGP